MTVEQGLREKIGMRLPVRQVTLLITIVQSRFLSKLPVRQVTEEVVVIRIVTFSKLPVRQVT